MLHTTQEHKNTNNKMADRQVAAVIISFFLLNVDKAKRRGKTRSWIKQLKQRGVFSNKNYSWGTLWTLRKCYEWIMTQCYVT